MSCSAPTGTVGAITRAALREYFEVNRNHIVVAALKALSDEGKIDAATVNEAMDRLGVDPKRPDPVRR